MIDSPIVGAWISTMWKPLSCSATLVTSSLLDFMHILLRLLTWWVLRSPCLGADDWNLLWFLEAFILPLVV